VAIAVTLSHNRLSGFNTPPYGVIEHYDFLCGIDLEFPALLFASGHINSYGDGQKRGSYIQPMG